MIIYDLETKTFNNKVDSQQDRLKVFAYKNTTTGESGCLFHTERSKIQHLLLLPDTKVGFNNWRYDDVILRREGYQINGEIRDLYYEMRNLTRDDGWTLPSYSLANICKTLGISNKQNGFDYSLLLEDKTIKSNWEIIEKYALQDIKCTEELLLFVDSYRGAFKLFKPIKELKGVTNIHIKIKPLTTQGNASYHNPLLVKFLAKYNLGLEEDTSNIKINANSIKENTMVKSSLNDNFESDIQRVHVADDSYKAQVVGIGNPYETTNQSGNKQEKFVVSFKLEEKKSDTGEDLVVPMFPTTTNSPARGKYSASKLNLFLALLKKDEEFEKYWNEGENPPAKKDAEKQKDLFTSWMTDNFVGKKFRLFTKTINPNEKEKMYSTVDRVVEAL